MSAKTKRFYTGVSLEPEAGEYINDLSRRMDMNRSWVLKTNHRMRFSIGLDTNKRRAPPSLTLAVVGPINENSAPYVNRRVAVSRNRHLSSGGRIRTSDLRVMSPTKVVVSIFLPNARFWCVCEHKCTERVCRPQRLARLRCV
jgi:hypothetical protein